MKNTFLVILSTLILSAITAKSQNTWEQITPTGNIPGFRQGHSMVTIDDKIYLFGGMDGSKSFFNDISIYDSECQNWYEEEPANTPPPARFGHKAVVKDGKMYVFFGQGASDALDDIWEYDPATKEWTQIVPASSSNPVARFDHTAIVSGSVVWIAGGLDNNGNPLNDLWYYSFDSNEFTQCNNIPAANGVYAHVSACSGSEVYVFGGYQGSEPVNTMYKYTIGSAGTWTTETIQGTLPAPTAYSASAQYGQELYIAGGETSTGVTGSTYVWDMSQQQFTQLADGPAWAYGAFAFLYSPNIVKQEKETEYAKILFWGGSSDFVNYNEETWIYTTDIEISTSIDRIEIPTGFELYQNYPNPFNSETIILFSLPSNQRVVLTVYDLTGKKIATITDNEFSSGVHSVKFDGSNLTSGVYSLKMKGNNYSVIKKMILMK